MIFYRAFSSAWQTSEQKQKIAIATTIVTTQLAHTSKRRSNPGDFPGFDLLLLASSYPCSACHCACCCCRASSCCSSCMICCCNCCFFFCGPHSLASSISLQKST